MAVVVTTAGPGVGNTPGGMLEAASMNIPLLQIGGAVAMSKRDAGDLQDMSTLTLMEWGPCLRRIMSVKLPSIQPAVRGR